MKMDLEPNSGNISTVKLTIASTSRDLHLHPHTHNVVHSAEQGEDERVQIEQVERHDARQLHPELLSRVVALQQAELVEQGREEVGDERHHQRQLVLAVPRGGLRLGGALHQHDDRVGGADQQQQHAEVGQHALSDRLPADLLLSSLALLQKGLSEPERDRRHLMAVERVNI